MNGRLVTASDVWEEVVALFEFPGEFRDVHSGMSLSDRFNAIKHNYRRKQAMVDAGIDDWFHSDPYEIADWMSIFTPIESALWCDIRCRGLDLWPQYPVGRFFVDFGNPAARVAVECDGKEWHQDVAKDCARDQQLNEMGWMVVRIPGWQCNRPILTSLEAQEKHGITEDEYESWLDHETPHTSLRMVEGRLERQRRDSERRYALKHGMRLEE